MCIWQQLAAITVLRAGVQEGGMYVRMCVGLAK
jgi:hypothetical protein